jgi:hypothetical protein
VGKQIEGQIAWAFSDAMWQEITIKDGRTVEGNFDQDQIARMADYTPQIRKPSGRLPSACHRS